jgi:hypothetical protein
MREGNIRDLGEKNENIIRYDANRYRMEGNVVRKLSPEIEMPDVEEERRNRKDEYVRQVRRNNNRQLIRPSANSMAFSFMFLMVSFMVLGYLGFSFINTVSKINVANVKIAKCKSSLSILNDENDAVSASINNKVDFNHVLDYALNTLHMVFPDDSTVVYYEKPDLSYVRQYSDIPDYKTGILDKILDEN